MTPELNLLVEAYFIPAQLVLAMLGMGATLRVVDFVAVFRERRGLAVGLTLQLAFVPLWAFAFVRLFDLEPGWAVGLLLVAVVPGGAFSNLLVFFARGSLPLSIALTVVCTSVCVFSVPLLLGLLAAGELPTDFRFPAARIVREIGSYLIVPLIVGMAIRRFVEERALAISRWSIRGSVVLLALVTVSALGSGRIQVLEYGWQPPAFILLFGASLALLTPPLARLLGRYDDETCAIGIEVTMRNVGVALLLIHFFFPGSEAQGQVLYTCLFYAGISGPVSLLMVLRHRFGRSLVLFRSPRRRPLPAATPEPPAGPATS